MPENIEPEETEVEETAEEAEVEAHAQSVLPLQGLGSPEADGLVSSSKSTFSVGC
jgi:hypothetical protein